MKLEELREMANDGTAILSAKLCRRHFGALIECAEVLSHAIAIGYFKDGGSTAQWARQALEKLEAIE